MRRLATTAFKTVSTALLAVLAMFVTVVPADAAVLHPWHTHGVYGVDGHGYYARSSFHGARTLAVRAYIYDGVRDGYVAGVEVRFKSGRATDRRLLWNPHPAGTTAVVRVQSYNYQHLYIRECVGVNAAHFSPRRCGLFHKYF